MGTIWKPSGREHTAQQTAKMPLESTFVHMHIVQHNLRAYAPWKTDDFRRGSRSRPTLRDDASPSSGGLVVLNP